MARASTAIRALVRALTPALLLLCECAAFTVPSATLPRLRLQGASLLSPPLRPLMSTGPAARRAAPPSPRMAMEWGGATRGLEGQVCLVTGASRGIGKGIAIALGEQGATVWVTGRTRAALEQTAKLVDEAGGHGVPCVIDHSEQRQIEKLFRRIEEEDGKLNVLVNNCYGAVDGLFGEERNKKFWDRPLSWWDTVNNIGLKAHFIASQLAVPLMLPEARAGSTALIVHVSSLGGMRFLFDTAYGVGKAAKDRMAADMAVELRDTDITVVSLWPGMVRTEKITSIFLNGTKVAATAADRTAAPTKTAKGTAEAAETTEADPPPRDPRSISRTISDTFDGSFDTMMRLGFEKSGETPIFVGRAVAGLARDRSRKRKAGRVVLTADLSDEYGFTDEFGSRPLSVRSVGKPVELLSPRLASLLPRGVKFPKVFLGMLGGDKFLD